MDDKELLKIMKENRGLAISKVKETMKCCEGKYTFDELMSVANESMIKSIRRYDKSLGFKLSTYIGRSIELDLLKYWTRDKWYMGTRDYPLEKPHVSTQDVIRTDKNSYTPIVIEDTLVDEEANSEEDVLEQESLKEISDFIEFVVRNNIKKNKENADRNIEIVKKYVLDGKKFTEIYEQGINDTSLQNIGRIVRKFKSDVKRILSSKNKGMEYILEGEWREMINN